MGLFGAGKLERPEGIEPVLASLEDWCLTTRPRPLIGLRRQRPYVLARQGDGGRASEHGGLDPYAGRVIGPGDEG
jgi:hypothetical protein